MLIRVVDLMREIEVVLGRELVLRKVVELRRLGMLIRVIDLMREIEVVLGREIVLLRVVDWIRELELVW